MQSLPDYSNLDLSGEAAAAAARMEARAQEPASQAMFEALIAPLLGPQVKRVLDWGCGTAAAARRLAKALPAAEVLACDKSEGMLAVARSLAKTEGLAGLRTQVWDALDEATFPFGPAPFDLIFSSVVMPYFSEAEAGDIVRRLAARLAKGGLLVFLEQDLTTDAVAGPTPLALKVLDKDRRQIKRTQGLGLRAVLRDAGLQVLPRRSFLWTEDHYGAYTRDLLERLADAALSQGRLDQAELEGFKRALPEAAERGDFYYGMVYHCVAGRRA